MGRNYINHHIERIQRAIETEKSKIAESREDIISTRNRKKSRIRSASSNHRISTSEKRERKIKGIGNSAYSFALVENNALFLIRYLYN